MVHMSGRIMVHVVHMIIRLRCRAIVMIVMVVIRHFEN